MNKKSKIWPWALAWAILVILSCYVRLYPLRIHLWDDYRDQATLMVVYNIKQSFLKQILSEAPTMPPALANHMAEEKLNETMHKNNLKIMDAINRITASMAAQANKGPQKIYLLESDPFDFYNLTENIVNTGHIAAVTRGSKYFNPLMCAPFGCWQPFTVHPYWGFIIYKFLQLFNPNISLMAAVAYTPLFTYLFIIAAGLWVCRVLNYSVIASFIGTLFLIMAPINLKRGSLGWFRTDPYNILFPLLLLGILFLALRPSSKKNGYFWAIIFGLTLSVYALFWHGWGFLFILGLICALTVAAFNFLIKKDQAHTRQNLLFVGLFFAANLFLVSLFFSFTDFFILFKEGFGELAKFSHRGLDLWPNLFMAVGELEKTSVVQIIKSVGGPVFILMALGGWFYSLRVAIENYRQNRTIDTIILTIFLIVTLTLSTHGERFTLFATIPLSLLAACAANRFVNMRSYGLPLALLLIAMIFLNGTRDIQTILTPIYNSTWDEALTKIKKDTPADSVINTWWAPGHFIKGMAHRSVPFDGASLDQSAIGFWMANMFLAQDENQARGILRMINSSGNRAAEFLVKCGLKLSDATTLLMAIASEDRAEATQTLKGIIRDDQINELISMIFDKHPHSYVLVFNELVDDNLMLAFTAHWNIKKMESINADPDLLTHVPKRNSPDFVEFLWDTMGGRPKYSEALSLLGTNKNQLIFRDNLMVDQDTMEAKIQSTTYGNGTPLSVFYLKNGTVVENVNPEGNLNYSIVLYQEDGQYVARLMDRALANSLIMKLYFFDGAGLKHFKPFVLSHDLTGRTHIKVFEVKP